MGRYPWLLLVLSLWLNVVVRAEDSSGSLEEEERPKPVFKIPKVPENAYLALFFTSDKDLEEKLVISRAKKDGIDDAIAKYDGTWSVEVPLSSAIDGDYALVLKSKAKHHAVSCKLSRPIKFDSDELVIQYEVKFAEGIDCGGAYIKLLSSSPELDLGGFNDKTPYTIMFGPDKCGLDNKFHFIFRHRHPVTGAFEEKHADKPEANLEQHFTDKKTHLYTLVLRSDNSFERYIDQKLVQSGSLLKDFKPAVNPPKEIDDPEDKKPDDWDDRQKIVDTTATKPDDWDETLPEFITDESATKPDGWLDDELEMIPDPDAEPPEDWNQEMDGDWEAPKIRNPKCTKGCGEWRKPMIRNPKFKGKWTPPLIDNPAYKGEWKPRVIPNPHYFEDKTPYRSLVEVAAVGLELWSMTDEIIFDNFLIVDSKAAADAFAKETWAVKQQAERLAEPKARSVVDALRDMYDEKPWLVFVIGLVCTLPILMCCIYFCRSSPADSALRKKTDSPTPDDVKHDSKNSSGADDDADGEDLDESGEEDHVQVSKGSGDDSDNKLTGRKVEQDGDSNEDLSAPDAKEEPQSGKHAVRKRRSRKD